VLRCRSFSLYSFLVPYWVTDLFGGNEMRFGHSNTPPFAALGSLAFAV
jgi:hypothetical protein